MKIDTDNKLIQIIASFSKEERIAFYDFLDSPYFNKRSDVRRLYKILEKRRSISQAIAGARVIQKLFPENYSSKETVKESDYPRLRNTMANLNKLAERFLLQRAREKNDLNDHRLLIDELMLHKLYRTSRSVLRKGFKQLELQPYKNRQFFYDKYRLNEAQFYLDILERNRSLDNSVQLVVEPFQHYYFANLLVYCCAGLNQSRILNVQYDLSTANEILVILKEKLAEMPVIIQLYYYVFLFLKEKEGKKYFTKAKQLFTINKATLETTDSRTICNFLLNFCSFRIREGELEYRKDRFDIYQQNLDRGLWNSGLYFSIHHFYLHVKNALEINELNEVNRFIDNFKDRLDPAYQKSLPILCYALLSFAKGEFRQAVRSLQLVDNKEDFFYTLYEKTLLIKLYLELEEWDKLELALEALRIYLSPKRSPSLSEQVRKTFQEFRRITNRFYRAIGDPEQKEKTKQIIREIKASTMLAERDWLLKKQHKFLSSESG